MRTVSNSPEQTRELGQALGRLLKSGSVVALTGELGAGKTVLAQGLARGLGVGADEYVSSPSFALINRYQGRVPVFHLDIYRLDTEAELVALGYEDYFEPEGVTIIEWADKIANLLPERRLLVEINIIGPDARELHIQPIGPWPPEAAAEIEGALTRHAGEKS